MTVGVTCLRTVKEQLYMQAAPNQTCIPPLTQHTQTHKLAHTEIQIERQSFGPIYVLTLNRVKTHKQSPARSNVFPHEIILAGVCSNGIDSVARVTLLGCQTHQRPKTSKQHSQDIHWFTLRLFLTSVSLHLISQASFSLQSLHVLPPCLA